MVVLDGASVNPRIAHRDDPNRKCKPNCNDQERSESDPLSDGASAKNDSRQSARNEPGDSYQHRYIE